MPFKYRLNVVRVGFIPRFLSTYGKQQGFGPLVCPALWSCHLCTVLKTVSLRASIAIGLSFLLYSLYKGLFLTSSNDNSIRSTAMVLFVRAQFWGAPMALHITMTKRSRVRLHGLAGKTCWLGEWMNNTFPSLCIYDWSALEQGTKHLTAACGCILCFHCLNQLEKLDFFHLILNNIYFM